MSDASTQASTVLAERFYPEVGVGGFSRVDGTVQFYSRIAALLKPTDRVLDYGAGRGGQIDVDPVSYRRWLMTLKGRVAHVEGCDVDPVVLENPYLDHAALFDPARPLPYADDSFDLIYSNWVFEHIDAPEFVASELLRVVKPNGYICAITPNKYGYIAIAARLAGNARHANLLKVIQPDRIERDVFPTRYRMNTPGALRKAFKGARVVVFGDSSDPSYHFNNPLLYGLFKVAHRLLPERLATALHIFVQKPGAAT